MEDSFLLEQIRLNNHKAFQEMVVKHQKLVINTCYGFVHNLNDAQDIAQEVFIEVYKSIGKFRQESKLSTWLYRISVNKSLNFIRDNKKNSWFQSLDVFFEKEKSSKDSFPVKNKQNSSINLEKLYDKIFNSFIIVIGSGNCNIPPVSYLL